FVGGKPSAWHADGSPDPLASPAGHILRYHRDLGDRPQTLVGYVMDLGYDAGIVVTNDYYKVRVGGLSKNSFLLIRPGSLKDLIEPEGDEEPADTRDLRAEGGANPGANPGDLFDLLARPRAQRPTTTRPFRHIPPHLVL